MNPIILRWTGRAVSKNRMHVVQRGGRRLIKTREYRAFLDSMVLSWARYRPEWPIGRFDVRIDVVLGPRMDAQNVIDPVLDALEQANIIANDRNLRTLTLHKVGVHDQGDDDAIEVVVTGVAS